MTTPNDNLALRVVNLQKLFQRERGGRVAAVDGLSLDIERGTMVTVLGPSGCGKTTLLRCIAGLERPTGGEIWAGPRLLSSDKGIVVPPERRGFGMMFQSYAVWPHMSVFENVAYSLKIRRLSRSEIESRVTKILDVVGIAHLRNEYSTRLSGGQQQRIALARCLVSDPEVILFDEPLSNVDAKVREELRVELLAMQRRIGFAGVYVTHDQEEAMAISDRIVVMNEGRTVQIGSPREIYRMPASRFVASFIGVVNLWPGRIGGPGSDGSRVVRTELGEIAVASDNVPRAFDADGAEVDLVVRPEALSVIRGAAGARPGTSVLPGVLRAEMFRGSHTDLFVEVGSHIVRARADDETGLQIGEAVQVVVPAQKVRVLPEADRGGSADEVAERSAIESALTGTAAAEPDLRPEDPSR